MDVMTEIILVAHNIRSTHNIGSLFRTCDGFGVKELIVSGYTPYPTIPNDPRLPHLREKIEKDIHKTALGAEQTVAFRVTDEIPVDDLRSRGYTLIALEQTPQSIPLPAYRPTGKIALILGEEVSGIDPRTIDRCDVTLEIPMKGTKESFNVSVAAAIALYHLTFPALQ